MPDSPPDGLIAWLYMVCGGLACLAALLAVVTAKGGWIHRLAGRVFFWAMIVGTAGVIWTSISTNALFTLLVAILSGYLAISGYRVLYLKHPVPRATIGPTRPGALDKGAAQFTLVACCALVAWGVMASYEGWVAGNPLDVMAPVMIVLGLLGAMMALGDMKRLRRPPEDPNHWLRTHAVRMLAAATVVITAASLGTLTMLPELVRWLMPIAIGSAAIVAWVFLIKHRIARSGDPRSFATIRIAESGPEPDTGPDPDPDLGPDLGPRQDPGPSARSRSRPSRR